MKLYFVRHGKTKGNQEGRYVGRSDEPLLEESIRLLKERVMPRPQIVVVSPMLRCRQTADCLYPGVEVWVRQGLKEMDFGDFEYKNYQELNGNADYQAYIDSGGKMGFPGGESLCAFKRRCCEAYHETYLNLSQKKVESAAFVVHGGTIMAVLEAYGKPKQDYFTWQLKNGEGLEGETDAQGNLFICKRLCAKEQLS